LVLLAGCKTASSCIGRIPTELQADMLRVVVEERYLTKTEMPWRDYSRAVRQGAPPSEHHPDHLRVLRRNAVRYQVCVKDATAGER